MAVAEKRKPARRKAPKAAPPAANPWPDRLKRLRIKLGQRSGRKRLPQTEAAALIKVSVRAWIAWELGEDRPSPPFALLIELLEAGKIE